jgi:hypothetical protein
MEITTLSKVVTVRSCSPPRASTGSFWLTGYSYMVAPLVPKVRARSCSTFLGMEVNTLSKVLTVHSCSPTCACMGGSCWLLDRVCLATPIPILPPICMAISSTYTCVTGSVSSHNVCTVAPRYGELLAYWLFLHGCSTDSQGSSPS